MSSEGDIVNAYEQSLGDREWAMAREAKPWVPLQKDPIAEARLEYERARAAGCVEEVLITLGKKYTDLRDAPAPVMEQPKRNVAPPTLQKCGRPKTRKKKVS